MNRITFLLSLFALLTLLAVPGCKKEEAAVPPSGEPAATGAPSGAAGGTETPKAAEPQAAPKNPMEAMAHLAQAAQKMAGQKPLGAVVNWRKLSPFAPDKIGDFAAEGEIKGSTAGMAGMQTSQVKRKYKAGERALQLSITDTSMVPMLRAGFAMAQAVHEDSSDGLKKGVEVDGTPGLLEWRAADKHGKLAVLAGGRFIVELRLEPTTDAEEVVKLAKGLDLAKLAAVKAE